MTIVFSKSVFNREDGSWNLYLINCRNELYENQTLIGKFPDFPAAKTYFNAEFNLGYGEIREILEDKK